MPSRPRKVSSGDTFVIEPEVRCKCGNKAVSYVECHNTDQCTPDQMSRSAFMCNSCIGKAVHAAQDLLDSGLNYCSNCHLQFVTISDILVKQCPITK